MTIPKPRNYRMPNYSTGERIETEHGLDEFRDTLYVEFTCYWEITPGQKGCHTQSNGDPGWPDEPSTAELLDVHVTKAEGEFAPIDRTSLEGIAFLDSLEAEVNQLVEDDSCGRYREEAFQAADDRDEGQRDAAADAAYERQRLGE